MKITGPTNQHLVSLISELKKKAIEGDVPMFKRLATELERPTRKRKVVNLTRINKNTKDKDFIVVPGKVLGTGDLDHSLTIAAYRFSTGAIEKINNSKSKAVFIKDLVNEKIEGKKIRIIG